MDIVSLGGNPAVVRDFESAATERGAQRAAIVQAMAGLEGERIRAGADITREQIAAAAKMHEAETQRAKDLSIANLQREMADRTNQLNKYIFDSREKLFREESERDRKEWDEYQKKVEARDKFATFVDLLKMYTAMNGIQSLYSSGGGGGIIAEMMDRMDKADRMVKAQDTMRESARTVAATEFASSLGNLLNIVGDREIRPEDEQKLMWSATQTMGSVIARLTDNRVQLPPAASPVGLQNAVDKLAEDIRSGSVGPADVAMVLAAVDACGGVLQEVEKRNREGWVTEDYLTGNAPPGYRRRAEDEMGVVEKAKMKLGVGKPKLYEPGEEEMQAYRRWGVVRGLQDYAFTIMSSLMSHPDDRVRKVMREGSEMYKGSNGVQGVVADAWKTSVNAAGGQPTPAILANTNKKFLDLLMGLAYDLKEDETYGSVIENLLGIMTSK